MKIIDEISGPQLKNHFTIKRSQLDKHKIILFQSVEKAHFQSVADFSSLRTHHFGM